MKVNPGASVGTTNSAGRRLPVLASSVRPTTSTACAWSSPEIHTFWPGQDPVAAVAAGGGGDAVRVRPGVGFGDGERHGDRAVGDAGHPALLLLVGAELGDDRAVDGGGDHHHQQRTAARRQLLHHQRQLVHAGAAAAVLLGQVHPDEAELACLAPQFVGVATGAGLLQVVVRAVVGGQRGDGLAQRLAFLALDEAGVCSLLFSSHIADVGHLDPGQNGAHFDLLADADVELGQHTVDGAVMVCSIFIASSHTRGCPAVTVSPSARPAGSPRRASGPAASPAATAEPGSGNRGHHGEARPAPSAEST